MGKLSSSVHGLRLVAKHAIMRPWCLQVEAVHGVCRSKGAGERRASGSSFV